MRRSSSRKRGSLDPEYESRPLVILDHEHQFTPWQQSKVFVKGINVRTCLLAPCEETQYDPEPDWVRRVRELAEEKRKKQNG